jgi:hypothetical protein
MMRVHTTFRARRSLRTVVLTGLMSAYYDDARARWQRSESTTVFGDGAVQCGPHIGMPTPLIHPVVVDQVSSNVEGFAS